jgi:hypothetical protein
MYARMVQFNGILRLGNPTNNKLYQLKLILVVEMILNNIRSTSGYLCTYGLVFSS